MEPLNSALNLPLNEEELDPICRSINDDLFRLGVLLNVDITVLEDVVTSHDDSFVKCRRLIEIWRVNVPSSDNERHQLVKALKKMKYARLASSIDQSEGLKVKMEIDSLTREDFDLVAHESGGEWEMLATHLRLAESEIATLRARRISLYQKAYMCLYKKMIMTGLDCNMLVHVLRQMGKGRLAKQLVEKNN